MRILAGFIIAGVLAGSTALQFVPLGVERNPPSVRERSLFEAVAVPADIARTLDRSCMDCHSNRTRWPWYGRVAPASLLLARDVGAARAVMNFSEWPVDQPGVSASLIAAIGAAAGSGFMPKPSYLLLHPGARLSDQEKRRLREWSGAEVRRLVAMAQARNR